MQNNKIVLLKNKYSALSPAVKAGIWFTLCNIIQRGIQFIVTPLYTRLLTTEQYGEYGVFITWLNLLMIFGTLNISGGVYYNGLIKNERDAKTYTSSLQILSLFCTCVTYCVVFLLKSILSSIIDIPYTYVIMMFIYTLAYPAIEFWSVQNRVNYNYKPILVVTIISALFAPIIGLLLVKYANLGAFGVITGFVLTNVIINGTIYIHNLFNGRFKIDLSEWKHTLQFSLPLIPHYLSQVVLGQFDRIMISFYCGEAKAGIYTLAYQVGLIMSILTTGINNAFTPWIYQRIKAGEYNSLKRVTNVLLVFFLVINVAIILVAPEIVLIMGTAEYQEAIWVIPPVMMSSFIMFAYCAFGTVLFYFEDTKRASISTAAGAILNIFLNAFFIPRYGYILAGYTTLVSYLLIFILYFYFMRKRCLKERIGLLFETQKIIGMIFILIFFSGISLILYNYLLVRYILFFLLLVGLIVNRRILLRALYSLKGDKNENGSNNTN